MVYNHVDYCTIMILSIIDTAFSKKKKRCPKNYALVHSETARHSGFTGQVCRKFREKRFMASLVVRPMTLK